MSKKIPDHLHKYKKTELGRNGNSYLVYRCMKPSCSHYITLAVAEGKICECSRCHEPMVITKYTLTRSNGGAMLSPHCQSCVKRKNSDTLSAIENFLKDRGL